MKTVTYDEMLWKLVPVDPTDRMLNAASLATESEGMVTTPWLRKTIYFAMLSAAPAQPTPQPVERKPMTDEEIERGRKETFSTENPFCPCDSKTMRKAVRWAELHHGIRE